MPTRSRTRQSWTARWAGSTTRGWPSSRRRSGSPTWTTTTCWAARRRCSTARSSRARTAGTLPTSAARTPSCAVRRSCSSAWRGTWRRGDGPSRDAPAPPGGGTPRGGPRARAAPRAAGGGTAGGRTGAGPAGPAVHAALDQVAGAVRRARVEVAAGDPVSEVTYRFQQRVDEAGRGVVSDDLARMEADLAEIANLVPHGGEAVATELDGAVLTRLAGRDWSPIAALESVKALVVAVDVELAGEAQPVMPLATISVTEDMATSMRLHGMGWRTVSRREVLARGLAPQDLGAMLQQRLRWSQGTLQVALKENPLVQRGLSVGQRLMYLATMWSYLAGFAAVVYIAAPVAYLFLGVRPVTSYGDAFLLHLVP